MDHVWIMFRPCWYHVWTIFTLCLDHVKKSTTVVETLTILFEFAKIRDNISHSFKLTKFFLKRLKQKLIYVQIWKPAYICQWHFVQLKGSNKDFYFECICEGVREVMYLTICNLKVGFLIVVYDLSKEFVFQNWIISVMSAFIRN